MSLYKAFNATTERGFVPYRRTTPAYKTLAEEAKEFEYTQTIPKKLKDLEERIENIETTLSLMRQAKDNDPIKAYLEPIASRIAQIEAQIGLEKAKTNGQIDIPNIIVPEELRVLKGKLGRCNNRKYEIVKRRWALWKAQYEAGVPMTTIARAWNCDHGTIAYARSNNWKASPGWGRAKRVRK
jgi:hypothetical protein